MIIPWGSDAPLYHRPIATIAMIVLCVLSFFVFPAHDYEDWTLVVGDGVHPIQWLTNLFMHAGLSHLVGNMLFLWAFGIIIEGKLGWWAFTLAYLGIGAAESAGIQLLMRSEQPVHVLGASGAIFGLLAMCLVWAPRNDLQCVFMFRLLPMEFDFPILGFAAFYIGMEVLTIGLTGFAISSALAHTCGAFLGFVLATALLKLKLVDCEHWDIFAVLQGRQGQSKKQAKKGKLAMPRVSVEFARQAEAAKKKRAKGAAPRVKSIEDAPAAALRKLRLHLELGEIEAAVAVYKKSSRAFPNWGIQEADWLHLVQAVLDQNAWGDAASLMLEYMRQAAAPAPRIQLKLAQVLLQKLARPMQALTVLNQIPDGALPATLEPMRRQLVKQAEHMREEGDLELQDELW